MKFLRERLLFLLGLVVISVYSRPQRLAHGNTNSPIIFVPGFGGSEIYVKLENSKVPHFYCETTTADYFLLWLGVYYLLPHASDCFAYNMQLIYDPKTRTTHSPEGVFTRVQNWGHTKSVEWISNVQVAPTVYFGDVIGELVKKHGYTRDKSVRGAPFDFRKAPNENGHVIINLVKLVEDTYEINDNSKVVLVGHSMGCLYLLEMLHGQSQAWKDKYIKAYVSASGPYAGAIKALKTMSSGDNLGVPIVDSNKMSQMSRSWPGQLYFLPHPRYWSANETLATTGTKNYTVANYNDFFKDVGLPEGVEIYKDVANLTDPRVPPGVKVHCVFSIDIPTPERLDWTGKSFPKDSPVEITGKGDGTVNMRSLQVCLNWRNQQKERVDTFLLRGVDHLATVKSEDFIQYVTKVAVNYK